MHLYTDASCNDRWGAYWLCHWLQTCESPHQQSMDIAWKELYIIVIAVRTWGPYWQHQKILFHCDNKAIVDIWEKGSTWAPQIMALVHLLYFSAAHYNISVCIVLVQGVCNDIADSLSHSLQMERFRRLAPQANLQADNIPVWPTQTFIDTSCNAAIMV